MTDEPENTALIIGAGPAGLTAAYELLTRSDIRPIVLERSEALGGISQTVNYRGNRIDIGGHRFFSKSDRVMQWWLEQLPLDDGPARSADSVRCDDEVMLLRPRRSRIYYGRQFYDYPLRLSADTVRKLGPLSMARMGASYLRSVLHPIHPVENLEQFFINRFGRELYRTFFESYTEKVWGRPCRDISAEWGAQRVKGLSIGRAIRHALARPFLRRDVAQKDTETSLIEQFLYPKHGPGQMWEHVARQVRERGGEIWTHMEVRRLHVAGRRISGVDAVDLQTGEWHRFGGDYFLSTMPVKQLVRGLSEDPPEEIRRIAEGLVYRDFITVGVLLDELKVKEDARLGQGLIRDNWIYVQEPDVRVGRIQIFNNWSPHMVADPSKVWLGLEYFCNENDDLWLQTDEALKSLAAEELARIGFIASPRILDGTVIRMPKTYPAYFGTYDRFDELRQWLDALENLFLVGRNGMHRYNNQDHSMLTAMVAVDNILAGRTDKANLWAVNTEQDYHEERGAESEERPAGAGRREAVSQLETADH